MGDAGGFKTITLTKDCDVHGVIRKAGTKLTVTPDFLKVLKDGGYLDIPKPKPPTVKDKKDEILKT